MLWRALREPRTNDLAGIFGFLETSRHLVLNEERIMILGMSTATYTFLHVLISLVGIGSGLIVMFGFLVESG